jgi:hypothetical protein
MHKLQIMNTESVVRVIRQVYQRDRMNGSKCVLLACWRKLRHLLFVADAAAATLSNSQLLPL